MLAIVAAAGYPFCCIFYRRFNVQFNIMTPLCMKCPMRNEGRRRKKKKEELKKETGLSIEWPRQLEGTILICIRLLSLRVSEEEVFMPLLLLLAYV